ncbi:hypothetical protein KSS87_021035 [Heliosperma pusillum]|nr:hypothetical protein KSS87_021035 [Heliosperma pusillum]
MGDCGDCDCKCDDCDCDCKCDDCDCNCDCDCLDGCCTGETNLVLCCFLPASNNTTTERNRSSTPTDCSCCFCCFRGGRNLTSPKSSKKTKHKGFCWRLRSCFRSDPSPPSSPPRAQPMMENVPSIGYMQDGRYPMKDGLDNVPPIGHNYNPDDRYPMNEDRFPPGYEERYRKRASWEELGMPPREHVMDGKWSHPVRHGDKYGGHL